MMTSSSDMYIHQEISLGTLDVAFFVLALTISVVIGIYFANKNKTLEEYMLGGRDQRLLPVSMSMMTSFVSGLTLVGNPAEMYYHGSAYSLVFISVLLSVPFSTLILLPVFYRSGNISVFAYLEHRFSKTIKRLVSIIFIIQMTLYNAVVLYVPSLSLKSVLGISDLVSIGAVGASCLVYCTLGGIKAVIWTDFFQAALMYLLLICICVSGTLEIGGIGRLFEVGIEGRRLSLENFFDFDLATRHTLFTLVTGGVIINIFMNGANQIQVQRALTLPTLRLAQWSQLLTALFTVLISLTASYAGLILFAAYNDCDPFANHQIDKRDAILIYYVKTHLDGLPGLRGMFVAGIFAATLSTLSSFQNSMSALVLEDFIIPLWSEPMDESTQTRLGRFIALLFGLACIGLTFIVGRISGLLQVALTLFGALGAPFIGAFFLGMLTRFTNSIGMLVGMLFGTSFGIYMQVYQALYLPPLEPTLAISTSGCPALNSTSADILIGPTERIGYDIGSMSYLWLPAISLTITVIVSVVVSLFTGGCHQEVADEHLAWWLQKDKQGVDEIHAFRSQKQDLMNQLKSYVKNARDEF